MKMLHAFLAATLAAIAVCQAQTPRVDPPAQKAEDKISDTEEKHRWWDVSLPTGSYIVALDRITSVSLHQYVLDGSLVVTEVVVDTIGQSLVRFYSIAPASDSFSSSGAAKSITGIVQRSQEILDRNAARVGTNMHEMVVKQYPTTTHSRTVEYRLLDERDLRLLHESARKAWTSGRGRKFTLK